MPTNDDILMISDLLDKKLKPIEVRFGQMQEHSDKLGLCSELLYKDY